MNAFVPPFAAIDVALIKIAVVVVFFVVAGIAKLLAKLQQIPPPDKRPNPPPPRPDDVGDEIEEFMRRAATRQRSPKGERRVAVEQATQTAEPILAEALPEPTRPVGGQVGQHVEKYLDEQGFRQREVELGKEVVKADQQIDQRLHQTFDHRVSKLEAVPGEAAAPPVAYAPPDLVGAAADIPDTFATGLLDLITTPDSLRQAIILSEILHRPEERWV